MRKRLSQSTSPVGLWHALNRGNSIPRTQEFADEMLDRMEAGERLAAREVPLTPQRLYFN